MEEERVLYVDWWLKSSSCFFFLLSLWSQTSHTQRRITSLIPLPHSIIMTYTQYGISQPACSPLYLEIPAPPPPHPLTPLALFFPQLSSGQITIPATLLATLSYFNYQMRMTSLSPIWDLTYIPSHLNLIYKKMINIKNVILITNWCLHVHLHAFFDGIKLSLSSIYTQCNFYYFFW